tara:strand:+ start:453 stop:1133 length:681 start_codon:yes stop_codon:yes gene_type:complete
MNKLESTIPFDGFYNSYISSDIEHQIGQQIEWDSDIYDLNEDEQQILWDNYLSVNRSYFYNQIAEHYSDLYIDALNERLEGFTLKATYKFFTSPKEYNFETDRIFIEIEENHCIEFIEHIVKNYKKELEKKIQDRFTSRSGFNSFYKNSLNLWTQDYSKWDHNQIGTCFELFDFDELNFYESLSETIIFNLGNTLGQEGIDLLDKKQKEKDKKELMDKQQLKLKLN